MSAKKRSKNVVIEDLDAMTRHYLVTALWSSTDENEDPMDSNYSLEDISQSAIRRAIEDCTKFSKIAAEELEAMGISFDELDSELVGHDFWLTRNGHGAGFWDGDYEEETGRILTKISKRFGSIDLYVGDDGSIYF